MIHYTDMDTQPWVSAVNRNGPLWLEEVRLMLDTGALTGTMEVWLEPVLDGAILNYFLHAEPAGVAAWQLARMDLAKATHRRRVAGKRMAFEVKAALERSRPVGTSRPS